MIKKSLIIIYVLCLAVNHFAAITVTSPSYGETVKAAEDFATAAFQDPWDMDKRTDLGWFIFDVVSGSKSNLTDITFSNGVFSASSTSNDPQISILETGSPNTALQGKIGTNYKINANKYKVFAIRMKLNKSHDGLLFWSRDTIYNGMSRSGIFSVYSGWAIYIINIPSLGAYPVTGSKITWSGNIDSLRLDPAPVKVDVKIDWIRLVENNSALYRTVRWTGNSGNVDIYLDNDKNQSNGTLGLVAKNVSGRSYSLYVGALSPGIKYYVGVKNSSGGSLRYSSGYYRVNDIPFLEFTSPSEEGGEDFAETVLGNAWDMNALSDLDYYARVSNLSITNITTENLQGDNLGSISVLKGTNIPVTGNVGDPILYTLLWWGNGRGQYNPIDSDKYRILVLKMAIPGNWDLVGGSVARVIWKKVGDGDKENVARSFIVRHKKPKVVMNTIIADMENLPLESGAGSPSHTGWNGMIEGFRVDPNEFSSAKDFYIQEIKLTAFERADDSYTFKWNYTDSVAESSNLKLYYDTNNSGFNGTLIKSGIDPSSEQYTWNISNNAEGTYYIYAVVSDGLNTNRTYARWPIVIDHSPSASPTISLSKTSMSFSATGNNSKTFTISNSGGGTLNWTVTDNTSWMSVSPASGQNSGTVTVTVNRSGLSAGTYTGTVIVTDSNATNSPQTVSVSLTISSGGGTAKIDLSRSVLYFGTSGSTSTNPQIFLIENSGTGTMYWNVSTSAGWLSCSPTSGSNSGVVSVSVNGSGLSRGTYNGTVTVRSSNATNSPRTISVTLKVYKSGTTSKPFGQFATPVTGALYRSSMPVTGWVLDDIGLDSVKIYNGSAYVGDAIFVEGARADVEQAYPGYPQNYQAGWGYMLLSYFLPNGGNGTYTIYARATDKEGHQVTLGSKTIILDNANAVKPFGAIDTPSQGGIASGNDFNNAGWVLTPQPNKVPVNGSTIEVYVDSVKLGTATYNIYRGDIASYFPGYANSNAAAAYFKFDTTAYSNGIHTIHWIAADDAGNKDGVGSRFFTIRNLEGRSGQKLAGSGQWPVVSDELFRLPVDDFSPIGILKGFNRNVIPKKLYPDDNGNITIEIYELQHLEIRLFPVGAAGLAPLYNGYRLVGSQLRPLPIGSTFDLRRGIFYWSPAPGFVGNYELVFIDKDRSRLRRVNIKILSK